MHPLKSKIDYSEYIQSDEWKFKSKAMRWIAGYRCQLCNSNNDTLDTHHRTYDNLGNETPSDLIVLCRDCHSKFHEKEQKQEVIPAISRPYITALIDALYPYEDDDMIDVFLIDGKDARYLIVSYDEYNEKISNGQYVTLVGYMENRIFHAEELYITNQKKDMPFGYYRILLSQIEGINGNALIRPPIPS